MKRTKKKIIVSSWTSDYFHIHLITDRFNCKWTFSSAFNWRLHLVFWTTSFLLFHDFCQEPAHGSISIVIRAYRNKIERVSAMRQRVSVCERHGVNWISDFDSNTYRFSKIRSRVRVRVRVKAQNQLQILWNYVSHPFGNCRLCPITNNRRWNRFRF